MTIALTPMIPFHLLPCWGIPAIVCIVVLGKFPFNFILAIPFAYPGENLKDLTFLVQAMFIWGMCASFWLLEASWTSLCSFVGKVFWNWLTIVSFSGWERLAGQDHSAGFVLKAQLEFSLLVYSWCSLSLFIWQEKKNSLSSTAILLPTTKDCMKTIIDGFFYRCNHFLLWISLENCEVNSFDFQI